MKKKSIISSFSLGAVTLVITAWLFSTAKKDDENIPPPLPINDAREQTRPAENRKPISVSQGQGLTINRAVKNRIAEKNASTSPFRFDVEYIFNALSAVRTDPDGNLIVNSQTLELLEAAFSKLDQDISEDEMQELQELIQLGLLGDAGMDAAKIVGDYYQYRSAEKDFLESNESIDVSGISQNFEQLVALRQAYLGYEVAEKLYGEEQRANRFMIEAMKIQEDPNLSDAEKEHLQTQLSETFEAQLDSQNATESATDPQWLQRYQRFDQDRQYILDAGLAKEEQNRQVEELLQQHFSPDEIDKARNFRPR